MFRASSTTLLRASTRAAARPANVRSIYTARGDEARHISPRKTWLSAISAAGGTTYVLAQCVVGT